MLRSWAVAVPVTLAGGLPETSMLASGSWTALEH